MTPWTVARQAPLSPTTSWSFLKSISVVSVMLSNHLQGKKLESRENSLILLICSTVITIVGDLLDYYEGPINSTFMALSHTVVLGIC